MAHAYSFYTCSNSLLSKAVLLQNYGSLKYDGTQVTHSGLILEPDKSLITPDSLVLESTFKYGGVKFTTLKNIIKRNANLSITEFDCPITYAQYNKMWDAACSIEGLPYDTKGILGLAVDEDWQETDMFFCSEAEAYILLCGEYKGIDWHKYDLSRISPKELRTVPQTIISLPFNI